MKYNVRYRIVDGNGNAVENTSLSSGLKTNSGGSAYSQNVTSFAPISALIDYEYEDSSEKFF